MMFNWTPSCNQIRQTRTCKQTSIWNKTCNLILTCYHLVLLTSYLKQLEHVRMCRKIWRQIIIENWHENCRVCHNNFKHQTDLSCHNPNLDYLQKLQSKKIRKLSQRISRGRKSVSITRCGESKRICENLLLTMSKDQAICIAPKRLSSLPMVNFQIPILKGNLKLSEKVGAPQSRKNLFLLSKTTQMHITWERNVMWVRVRIVILILMLWVGNRNQNLSRRGYECIPDLNDIDFN